MLPWRLRGETVLAMPRRHPQILFPNTRGNVMLPSAWKWYWNPTPSAFLSSLPDGHWLLERHRGTARKRTFDLYELRHRAATWMSELPPRGLGLDPAAVAAQLGHRDGGRLVMRLYRHMDQEEALKRVGDAFRGDPGSMGPDEIRVTDLGA